MSMSQTLNIYNIGAFLVFKVICFVLNPVTVGLLTYFYSNYCDVEHNSCAFAHSFVTLLWQKCKKAKHSKTNLDLYYEKF